MKLTVFLILLSFVQLLANNSYAQKTKLTVDLNNTSIEMVLLNIENQSNFKFIYNKEKVDVDSRVSLQIKEKSINETLDALFEGKDVSYTFYKNQVILTNKSEAKPVPTQQQKSVSGKVTDSTGASLPGVSVVVKGTTIGVITDIDGKYLLSKIPENATLQFSFVGMKGQEVIVGNQSKINVSMLDETIGLDEVVAIGYGTQKRSDITGSVASVSTERLEQLPNNNIADVIRGSIAGVTVRQTDATAEDSNNTILIRGRNSISANNDPLIILDGIPYTGSLSEINPNDIGAMEVLKDASSTAIYGSRASNGVIIITTKRGNTGKPRLSYDGYYSIQTVPGFPKPMTGPEFYEYKTALATNTNNPNLITASEEANYQAGNWTDYTELILQQGHKQQHNLSLSGANDYINYYISGTILDVKGITINDKFNRSTLRSNIEVKLREWLSIGTSTTLALSDRSGRTPDFRWAYKSNPLTIPYDEEGNLIIYTWPENADQQNPIEEILIQDSNLTYNVLSNNFLNLDIPFIPGLSYRLNTGITYIDNDKEAYHPRTTSTGLSDGGRSEVERRLDTDWIVENILNYKKSFAKHNVFFTGLYSAQQDKMTRRALTTRGFPNDVLTTFQENIALSFVPSSGYNRTRLISQMARLNYNFASRYLLTLTARRDGFSGFGENTKFGFFPSAAIGWNIHEESFFKKNEYLNSAKLRLSYGSNGNQAVGAYSTLSRLGTKSYLINGTTTAPGYIPSQMGFPDLGWESSTTANIGIDLGMLSNRIQINADLYHTKTKDLLLNRSISSVHGITKITQNIGETKNQGIELSLTSYNISMPSLKWESSLNFSFNKNEIVDLYGDKQDDVGNRWFIGQPIRVVYSNVFDGIFQIGDDIASSAQPTAQPGYAKVVDQITVDTDGDGLPDAGDGKIDANDNIIRGQRDPKITWGLNNTITWKGFGLYFLFYGLHGHVDNNEFLNTLTWDGRMNDTKKNWWTPENPTNEYWSIHTSSQSNGVQILERKGFVRLKDVSLSYTIPTSVVSKIKMNNVKVYFTARNLKTWTKWSGWDPELEFEGLSVKQPLQREYLIGLNIGF